MKRALPRPGKAFASLAGLCLIALGLTACDETMMIDGMSGTNSSAMASSGGSETNGSLSADIIDRARPEEIDRSKYTMIVPVQGSEFQHDLFKSPAHASEAGYCLSSGFGDVTRVIQASDPRTRQSFYFIECEKSDPSLAGLDDRIADLQAQQAGFNAKTAEMRAAAQAAASQADTQADPYADCEIGQGGYPIVRDGCGPKGN